MSNNIYAQYEQKVKAADSISQLKTLLDDYRVEMSTFRERMGDLDEKIKHLKYLKKELEKKYCVDRGFTSIEHIIIEKAGGIVIDSEPDVELT